MKKSCMESSGPRPLTPNLQAVKVCSPKLRTLNVAVIVSPTSGLGLEICKSEIKRTSAGLGVGVTVGVDVGVCVTVGVLVGIDVIVGVLVGGGVAVSALVGDSVAIGLSAGIGVGAGVGVRALQATAAKPNDTKQMIRTMRLIVMIYLLSFSRDYRNWNRADSDGP